MTEVTVTSSEDTKQVVGDDYKGQNVLIEFVSANPNSPITAGNARGGAVGDAIGNILESLGARVTREFYINDALNTAQMRHFGRSVEIRYLQACGHDQEMPSDGYRADYVLQLGKRICERVGDKYIHMLPEKRLDLFTKLGEEEMLAVQKEDLEAFGVSFDNWFTEKELYSSGKVNTAINTLKERGCAYETDGALWLKSTDFGDSLDRALIRENGDFTYIASDTAYHADKFDRGFDRLIDVWGSQHQGYVARTIAAVKALGIDLDKLDILIHGSVQVFSGAEMVSMSRRKGEHILLRELVDEIGKDAARFFLLSRPIGEPIQMDIELVTQEAPDNPLYAVRQALKRMSGVISAGSTEASKSSECRQSETRVADLCAGYTNVVRAAANQLDPHILWAYATQIASAYHNFHTDCGGTITETDVALTKTAKETLENALAMLGISAQKL